MRFPANLSILVTLLVAAWCGCRNDRPATSSQQSAASSRPQVFVTNYPLQYFAQRIGGEFIDVHFPMNEQGDPAFWQPDAATVARYQQASLILINGASAEKWVANATLPESKLVDTSAGFAEKFIQMDNAETHSHGPEGERSHTGTVFTTWIDFDQAAQQATTMRNALLKLLPDRSAEFDRNLESLLVDLKQLDQDMAAVARRIGDRPLVASHPIYQYFARRYGLHIESVLWEPERVPDNKAMADLQKLLQSHPAKIMIWEGEPAEESIQKLKDIGLASVVFDPCANVSHAGDWLKVMQANVKSLGDWAAAIQ